MDHCGLSPEIRKNGLQQKKDKANRWDNLASNDLPIENNVSLANVSRWNSSPVQHRNSARAPTCPKRPINIATRTEIDLSSVSSAYFSEIDESAAISYRSMRSKPDRLDKMSPSHRVTTVSRSKTRSEAMLNILNGALAFEDEEEAMYFV